MMAPLSLAASRGLARRVPDITRQTGSQQLRGNARPLCMSAARRRNVVARFRMAPRADGKVDLTSRQLKIALQSQAREISFIFRDLQINDILQLPRFGSSCTDFHKLDVCPDNCI